MKLKTCATADSRPALIRPLGRLATTGIYMLRGIPRDLQGAARARAVTEGTTVHGVLLKALREYAAGTWTPRPEDEQEP